MRYGDTSSIVSHAILEDHYQVTLVVPFREQPCQAMRIFSHKDLSLKMMLSHTKMCTALQELHRIELVGCDVLDLANGAMMHFLSVLPTKGYVYLIE